MARPADWPDDWPHPDDGIPEGWRELEWLVYCAGTADERLSYEELGHLVGRKKGTVSSWVGKWRARYGADFFPRANKTGIPKDAVIEGARRSGMNMSAGWAEVREAAADGYGAGAWLALQLSGTVAAEILADPARRGELDAGDVLRLARAGEIWARVADRLAGIPDPGRMTPGGNDLPEGDLPPAGLLAGFEGSPMIPTDLDGEDAVTMEAVATVMQAASVRLEVQRSADVIDVDGAPSS